MESQTLRDVLESNDEEKDKDMIRHFGLSHVHQTNALQNSASRSISIHFILEQTIIHSKMSDEMDAAHVDE